MIDGLHKMQRWHMEIAKMAGYIAFPVALFHWFNRPQNYEEWVIKEKRKRYPPTSEEDRNMWAEVIRNFNEKRELEQLEAMEKVQKLLEESQTKLKD